MRRREKDAGSEGNTRTWTDGIDHFSSIFFSNGVQFEREKSRNEEGECSIRFDSKFLDDKAALTKKNSAEWNQLIGAVLSCGES